MATVPSTLKQKRVIITANSGHFYNEWWISFTHLNIRQQAHLIMLISQNPNKNKGVIGILRYKLFITR